MNTAWRIPKGGSLIQAVMPGDLNAAANIGPWVSLKDYVDVLVNIVLAAGTSPIILAFQQAQDASGTGAKVLPITDLKTLSAVDINAPTSSELWNEHAAIHRQATVDSYDTTAAGGTTNAQYRAIVRIHQDDVDDGFSHVRVNIAALAAARNGAIEMIAMERANQGNANRTL